MKRSRPWLRWLALGLCAEASLWLFTSCRPFSDWQKRYPSNRALLIVSSDEVVVFENQMDTIHIRGWETKEGTLPEYVELSQLLKRTKPVVGATRTRAGQLIDGNGRILLDQIHEFSKFAYSPKHDLLVWETPSGSPKYGVNIRSDGKSRFVDTWGIDAIEIFPDGTIWLAESRFPEITGISVLDRDGHFLGWRVRGNPGFVNGFCEIDERDVPQLEHIKRSLNKQ